MKLKELEEQLKYLREQGATDDTEMVVYNEEWSGWIPVQNLQYCTYDPEEDCEEYDPVIVIYTE